MQHNLISSSQVPPLLSGIGRAAPFLESILGALGGPVLPSTYEASTSRGFTPLITPSFISSSLAFSFAVFSFALGLLVRLSPGSYRAVANVMFAATLVASALWTCLA